MINPLIDLHCDLLTYLSESASRSAYDPQVRCSIPQLREGNVRLQTMAVYTPTVKDSVQKAANQLRIYKALALTHPQDFIWMQNVGQWDSLLNSRQIGTLFAFENASGFCEENEKLEGGLQRLQQIEMHIAKPLYISLTWNMENRFGGGALTKVGLKLDGKRLLDYLHDKKIAVDLSHASDSLVHDIFNHMDHHGLNIPIMASHSNLRCVMNAPRNLPDDLAQEVLKRGGVIGLTWIRLFVGTNSSRHFVKHIEKLLEWGGENQICLGADFFYENDVPPEHRKTAEELFFRDFDRASCLVHLEGMCKEYLQMNNEAIAKFTHQNFLSFWRKFCF